MASIRSAYALWVEKSQLFEYQLAAWSSDNKMLGVRCLKMAKSYIEQAESGVFGTTIVINAATIKLTSQ